MLQRPINNHLKVIIMDNRIYNRANAANSLQISIMGKVDAVAEFSISDGMGGKEPFLLKNITEDPIQVEVVLAGMEEPITTTIYSGWNVELVKQVNNAVADTLQYGY
ncbi:hypothetical protein crAss002_21 [Bacteroides phage crAss002]|uniref:Uncharacterized protein n=1 Tax=Bacteroides phage crAss002 TaxID=2709317 RepID=A0A7S5UNV9_9CAUD|nr:hypothetical protein KNU86_gp21 [Bacteroides phage crAss002]QIG59131.1 hypothetical protein crAss002_21 [Bacteroides phage crAss002]DAT98784.1 MAG TPA: hypothetical protein [Crassvirales sp.]